MRTSHIALVAAAVVLAAASSARADDHAEAPAADIVETAVAAGSFQTLVTAVKAAGLVEALQGDGPFTVFAPTDDAFAALPEGTVAALLEPANRDELKRILTFHVVPGRVLAQSLLPVGSAETLSGDAVPVGLRVGGANVLTTDILCSNGVIHVIDRVMLPPTRPPSRSGADARIEKLIATAIERGVPVFNAGDAAACARIYREAARRMVQGQDAGAIHRMALTDALTALSDDAESEAWALREVFDRILADLAFEPRVEAPMPEGFPGPGPVGRVVAKTYPACRAARAEGRGAFWTLFQHIQSNEIPMTAPVEMTMDENLREQDMAFLYERVVQGAAGRDGKVDVLDREPVQVLSIGMRGVRDNASEAMAKKALEAALAEHDLEVAGAWRALGYNSPMVPAAQRYWELQVPVK